MTDQSREEQIRTEAYLKWEAAGCPEGDGVEFWVAAEEEANRASQEQEQSRIETKPLPTVETSIQQVEGRTTRPETARQFS